jgi:hypothetical protein
MSVVLVAFTPASRDLGFRSTGGRAWHRSITLASLFVELTAILTRRSWTTKALGVRVLVRHSPILLVALVRGVLLDVALATLSIEILASRGLVLDLDLRVGAGSLVAALLRRDWWQFRHRSLLF